MQLAPQFRGEDFSQPGGGIDAAAVFKREPNSDSTSCKPEDARCLSVFFETFLPQRAKPRLLRCAGPLCSTYGSSTRPRAYRRAPRLHALLTRLAMKLCENCGLVSYQPAAARPQFAGVLRDPAAFFVNYLHAIDDVTRSIGEVSGTLAELLRCAARYVPAAPLRTPQDGYSNTDRRPQGDAQPNLARVIFPNGHAIVVFHGIFEGLQSQCTCVVTFGRRVAV